MNLYKVEEVLGWQTATENDQMELEEAYVEKKPKVKKPKVKKPKVKKRSKKKQVKPRREKQFELPLPEGFTTITKTGSNGRTWKEYLGPDGNCYLRGNVSSF